MKKMHIIAFVVIAVAIGMIVATAGEASQYVAFKDAFALAEQGDLSKVHVVGQLKKNDNGDATGIEYNPAQDPNFLAFTMIDQNNEEHRVVCYNPPASMQDFAKSEQVVIIGRVKDGQFIASDILMKCPSKYEETTIKG